MSSELRIQPRSGEPGQGQFQETRWSLVLDAGTSDPVRASKALERLCSLYWFPLYTFVRRSGHDHHEAQDITQGFFAALLSRDAFHGVERQGSKFRTFLLAALKNYLRDSWARNTAQKRGGGCIPISMDALVAAEHYYLEPASLDTPDKIYDREWALTLLRNTLSRLEQDFEVAGKSVVLKRVRVFLMGPTANDSIKAAAAELGLPEETVKKTVQRMRRRYLEYLREEIQRTVGSSKACEVDEELAQLRQILRET